jgi:hypothetical protein
MHIDLWYNGMNVLRDSGTISYNTGVSEYIDFSGTSAHNTACPDGVEQMVKGPRFIWYYWPMALNTSIEVNDAAIIFNGTIRAFRQTGKNILLHRTITMNASGLRLIVEDFFENTAMPCMQFWNTTEECFAQGLIINSFDSSGQELANEKRIAKYCDTYGHALQGIRVSIRNTTQYFKTFITMPTPGNIS